MEGPLTGQLNPEGGDSWSMDLWIAPQFRACLERHCATHWHRTHHLRYPHHHGRWTAGQASKHIPQNMLIALMERIGHCVPENTLHDYAIPEPLARHVHNKMAVKVIEYKGKG